MNTTIEKTRVVNKYSGSGAEMMRNVEFWCNSIAKNGGTVIRQLGDKYSSAVTIVYTEPEIPAGRRYHVCVALDEIVVANHVVDAGSEAEAREIVARKHRAEVELTARKD